MCQSVIISIPGNKTLARVLPQIYNENKEPVHRQVAQLVTLLPDCEAAEKTSLLQLFGLVVHNQPRVNRIFFMSTLLRFWMVLS